MPSRLRTFRSPGSTTSRTSLAGLAPRAQPDASPLGVDAEHAHLEFLAHLYLAVRILHEVIGELRYVYQTVLVHANIDEGAEYAVSVTGETYTRGPESTMPGRDLRRLSVTIHERPGSALVRYRRQ